MTSPLATVRPAPLPEGIGELPPDAMSEAALSSAIEPTALELKVMTFPKPGLRITVEPVIMKRSAPAAIPVIPFAVVALAASPLPPRTPLPPKVALPVIVRVPPWRTKMDPP